MTKYYKWLHNLLATDLLLLILFIIYWLGSLWWHWPAIKMIIIVMTFIITNIILAIMRIIEMQNKKSLTALHNC